MRIRNNDSVSAALVFSHIPIHFHGELQAQKVAVLNYFFKFVGQNPAGSSDQFGVFFSSRLAFQLLSETQIKDFKFSMNFQL